MTSARTTRDGWRPAAWHALALMVSAVAAAGLGALAGTVAGSRPAFAAPVDGLAGLATCLKQNTRLHVLIMLDASGSIRETDPNGWRLAATRLVLKELGTLARPVRANQRVVSVEVQLATFASDAAPVGDWHTLDGTTEQIDRDIAALADRPVGGDTDYYAALELARQRLAERSARVDGQPCQLLLWLTDGRYEPVDDGAPDFTARYESGVDQLCRAGGLLDRLRGDGVTLVAVALTVQLNPDGEHLLRRLTGQAEPACGPTNREPAGHYFGAADVRELVQLFYEVANVQDGSPQACARDGDGCVFQLDPGLRTFAVLIEPGGSDAGVTLQPPVGGPVALTRPASPGPIEAAGAKLVWEWVGSGPDALVVVRGELFTTGPDTVPAWVGRWTVRFATPGGAPTGQVYLYGDQEAAIEGAPRFVRGEPWTFGVRAQTVDGAPAASLPGAPQPQLAVTLDEGPTSVQPAEPAQVQRRSDGGWTVRFEAPRTWQASKVRVRLSLTVLSRSNVDISPPERTYDVAVVGTVDVRPAELHLPTLRGSDTRSATLTLRADDQQRCVWVRDGAARLSTDVGPVVITVDGAGDSPGNCLRVPAGAQRALKLTAAFEPRHGYYGRASGTLTLLVQGPDGEPDVIKVPVDVKVEPGPPSRSRYLAFAGMALLGLAPWLLFALFNRWVLARFVKAPVLVAGYRLTAGFTAAGAGSTLYRPDGARWRPEETDFHGEVPHRRRLDVEVDAARRAKVVFRARVPKRNPFGAPVVAVRARGRRCAEESLPAVGDDGATGPYPGIPISRDPGAADPAGRVVVLAPKRVPKTASQQAPQIDVAIVLAAHSNLTADAAGRIADQANAALRRLFPGQRAQP
jgi:hypothetical protein